MNKIIGIRREDKNDWEQRTPLVPGDVKELKEKFGIKTIVQPSKIRIFSDDDYHDAGAEINEDLSEANVILGVKEMPMNFYEEGKTYVFFSHTIKGQDYNMPMLKHMMNLKCNLIDYERVVDEKNRRLIFFGPYAGMAGMIETLHAFGQKVKLQGFSTPLEKIKQAYEYSSLEEAKKEIEKIGEEIDENGFPIELCPIVVGFTGYGNVSRGAQEIFNLLPHKVISGHILEEMYENFTSDSLNFYKVVFSEEDMVEHIDGEFDLQDYYDHPENYKSQFEKYIPYLSILMNCIYWAPQYPRLITKQYVQDQTIIRSNLNLKVVGDISCDIDGAIEVTHKVTMPDNPTYTYWGAEDRFEDGTHRTGLTIMAVDNLPCEFPRESSTDFSKVVKDYVESLAVQDFKKDFQELALPDPMRKALVLHRGELTPDYHYMKDFIKE
jgi:saccharopine dehydrogenase (NAD+, L-lysine forming)